MYKVIPDTNFLIYSFKHCINFEHELRSVLDVNYKLCMLKCVVDELEKLKMEFKGKEKLSVNLAIKFAKNHEIIEYNTGKYADDIILNYSKENKSVIICTNDKKLKRDVMDHGIPIVLIKQKTHFEFQGYLI
ncbi:Nucleotide binding protein PINc [Methanococcus vannielii SB]|jgi:rRNA-processing protein FCF1|uniref:Nucleotide binding protein PINc n=1 Tax=Methanococcus vannielii (strain ATCC 35089 / DSM 1224 / JCM 13029 / OCM 148 / SB) TaxID=406327 RepID=A6UPY7_METVS|nr:PIN domain-containing protein [Methanococcus vannielii]ABR54559.1 Nucleotide binding protein PINc [Methanococcus vannielii SB]